jgi:hypothetical protein
MSGRKLKASVVLLICYGACAQAQWIDYRDPRTPRTRDGKPDLSAPAPRLNGKPDLSGVWQVEPPPAGEIERLFPGIGDQVVPGDDPRTFSKYFINILSDYKQGEEPFQPAGAELFKKQFDLFQRGLSTTALCLPMGLPGASLLAFPFKIIQAPGVTVIMHELDGTHRQIYTDGRKHVPDPQPAWLGYSVGKWDGDTFVVETVGFNDKSWLDGIGHPHSEALRLTERYRRRDYGHMEMEVTMDDPKMYTKPFSIKVTQLLIPDSDIIESVCAENEKDRPHMGR